MRGTSHCPGPLGNPDPGNRGSLPARTPPSAISDNASSSSRAVSSSSLTVGTLALALPQLIHYIYIK